MRAEGKAPPGAVTRYTPSPFFSCFSTLRPYCFATELTAEGSTRTSRSPEAKVLPVRVRISRLARARSCSFFIRFRLKLSRLLFVDRQPGLPRYQAQLIRSHSAVGR